MVGFCTSCASNYIVLFFFSSRRRHTRSTRDWSSDVCSSDLPAAFCQFVPAPGLGGYTLDQVRRTTREIPPDLVEAILVETILHLGDGGTHNVSLNFSVMSRKLARSDADGLGGRAQRWLLDHLSRTDQVG